MNDPVQQALDAIDARRSAGIGDLGAELRKRIDELGDLALSTQPRQNAFAELAEALTPSGFELFLMPDRCRIDPNGHEIHLTGVFVDSARRQQTGAIAVVV